MKASNDRLALGIHFSHDASVSVCSPEGILFSLQEERVSRIKHHYGFPRLAVEQAFKSCGITGKDIGTVAFSTSQVLFPARRRGWVVPARGDRLPASRYNKESWRQKAATWLGGRSAREQKQEERFRQTRAKFHQTWGDLASRHWVEHVDFMRELGLLRDEVSHYYVAHHRAHAASAFRLSGLSEPTSILTCDGKGDGLSATIYRGDPDGKMHYLRGSAGRDSLGAFYQAITEALGFVPVDGEYKTMGLAAFGQTAGRENPFAGSVSVRDGKLHSEREWRYASYNERHPENRINNPLSSVVQSDDFRRHLEFLSDKDFAYFAQLHFEEVMLALASDALSIAGSRHLLGAGGVLLNVKANALIRDRLAPKSFFVFPDSADSGLAAGAAMEALYQEGHVSGPVAFRNPYLGHEWSDEAITRDLAKWCEKYPLVVEAASPEKIAEKIAEGKVLGSFQGRLEMGPRALGNRSVLADPRRMEVKDKINLLLKGREPFVPFAPSLLEEDAPLYWEGNTDYRYMTFAVKASDRAKTEIPAVVHVDGTLRPQVVSEEWNPQYAKLIRAFKKLTGIGVLVNTSFNRHGHAIVGSPDDALLHLVNGWVEGLYLGPYYVERKVSS